MVTNICVWPRCWSSNHCLPGTIGSTRVQATSEHRKHIYLENWNKIRSRFWVDGSLSSRWMTKVSILTSWSLALVIHHEIIVIIVCLVPLDPQVVKQQANIVDPSTWQDETICAVCFGIMDIFVEMKEKVTILSSWWLALFALYHMDPQVSKQHNVNKKFHETKTNCIYCFVLSSRWVYNVRLLLGHLWI